MEQIKDIYNKKEVKPIKRISYKPYNIEFAKKVFIRICSGIYGKEIEVSKQFETTISKIIKYIHNDYFQEVNGIGLIGPTGTRKTFIFSAMQKYMTIDNVKYLRFGKQVTFNFNVLTARSICGEYQELGYDIINKYSAMNIICIDDLGAEQSDVTHFGNKINVIESLIEERYASNKITHFTSNYKIDDIRKKYGERVYSRLIQTTNILELIDKDYRL